MNAKLTILFIFLITFLTPGLYAGDTIKSPSGLLKLEVTIINGQLIYNVTNSNDTVIAKSQLGINTSKANFLNGLTFVTSSKLQINETYNLPSGKTSVYNNKCNELDISLLKTLVEFHVIFRVYDDGIAYKYYIPGSGNITVTSENSNINIFGFDKCWGQKYVGDYSTLYPERNWTAASSVNSFCAPVLIKNENSYCLITEAANYGTYCVSTVKTGTGKGDFHFVLNGSVTSSLPLTTPWRTVIIGSLPTIVESVMVENLNPPTEIADLSWIKPGRASWDWGGQEARSPWNTLEIAKSYIDLAYKMGWEYFMLDDGWASASYKLSDIIKYGNSKGISILIWSNQDRFPKNATQIRSILQEWKNLGFKGVKIDFWQDDTQNTIQKYDMLISIAADLHLLVNLHGCTKPSGIRRRWPNLLTSEAVYGGEQYLFNANATTADHNINLVFTRNVIGPMDYTPTDFVWLNGGIKHLTTWGHQLALATMYESGIQHLIDSPNGYLNNIAKDYLKQLPVIWDETKCLEAEPGQVATLARRKGSDWYISSLCNSTRTMNVKLPFLEDGQSYFAQIYKDGNCDFDIKFEQLEVKKDDNLSVILREHGGATVKISKISAKIPEFTSYEAESKDNTLINAAVVNIDTDARCSENSFVGWIGNGNALKFNNINVPANGTYVLTVYYMTGETRNTYIQVNDQAPVNYSFDSNGGYSGNNLAIKSVVVTLNSGINSITFGNTTAYGVNIDKIVISPNTGISNLAVLDIISPKTSSLLTAAETIKIQVSNENSIEQTNVPVSYKINDGDVVQEIITSIPPQSAINYSFLQKANLVKGQTVYNILVEIQMALDSNPLDDTISMAIKNTATEIINIYDKNTIIYPEITTGIVNIKAGMSFNHGDLRIVNISGQIIYENNNLKLEKDDIYSFDLKNIPNGAYFLMLNSSAGVFGKKIIKQ